MKRILAMMALGSALLLAGCAKPDTSAEDAPMVDPSPPVEAEAEAAAPVGDMTGEIKVDGSSTVYPITEAVAEEFRKVQPGVTVTVGISGTGGGFKKFVAGETDLSNASRPVKDSELAAAAEKGIEMIELAVAFDGLAVMVNPENDWVDHLTVEELNAIWKPDSTVKTWADVRSEWPAEEIKLYGPDPDSGTFEYFTEAVVGEAGQIRPDFQPSTDDNVLVTGIAGDKNALGYFGLAYYEENADKLKLVAVDNGAGPVAPSPETVGDGTYAPLSRPLFIYVTKPAAERPEVVEFVSFYIQNAAKLAAEVGYIGLPAAAYELVQKRFDNKTVGSVFSGESQVGIKIEDILAKE